MKQKQNLWKLSQKIMTVISLTATFVLVYIFLFAQNLDVFRTNSFEETWDYRNYGEQRVINHLYAYHNAEELNRNKTEIITDLEEIFSVDFSNIQIKVLDKSENVVLVDTFVSGKYDFISTTDYLEYEITCGVQNPLTFRDGFAPVKNSYDLLVENRDNLVVFLVVFGLMSLLNVGILIKCAGRNKGEITTTNWEKIPIDLFLVVSFVAIVSIDALGISLFHSIFYQSLVGIDDMTVQVLNITAFFTAYIVMKTIESLAIRFKTKSLLKNTVIWLLCKFIVDFSRKIPIIVRTLIIGLVICAINGIWGMLSMHHVVYWLIFAWYNVLLLMFFCGLSWQMKLLQSGAE
ncbi:MAG: hypothetical protein R3Y07_07630, partial [Eubacteriales bacterium]